MRGKWTMSLALLLSACGPEAPSMEDAGGADLDGGASADAAAPADGGAADGGADAGTARDAGADPDAASGVDAGPGDVDAGVAPPPSLRPCSVDGWCAVSPAPYPLTLRAVGGTSSTDVWVVGEGGTLEHFDGSEWRWVASPTTATLSALSAVSAADVWAVGEGGVALRWDGLAWAVVASGVAVDLHGFWRSGAADGWAVGAGGAILRFDGTSFRSVASPTSEDLLDVFGLGPDDVWAVGDAGTVLHWDGSAWTQLDPGTTVRLEAVWASGPSDVWVAGASATHARFDGVTWEVTQTSGSASPWLDVGGTGPDDVWLLAESALRRWDGASYTSSTEYAALLRTVDDIGGFRALGRLTAGELWLVGAAGLVGRLSGDRWELASFGPTPRWSSVAPASGEIFVAGANEGRVNGYVAFGPADRLANTAGSTLGTYRSVWASGPDDAWAVGSWFSIKRWDGVAWGDRSPLSGAQDYRAVTGLAADDVWLIDRSGAHHWDGGEFSTLLLADGGRWARDAALIATDALWVVGSGGRAYSYDGVGWWTDRAAPTSGDLNAVHGTPTDGVWVVGQSGEAFHHDGARWSSVATSTTAHLQGVWVDGGEVWIAGHDATVLRYDGAMLHAEAVPTDLDLEAVAADAANVWAVGERGIVLHRSR